MEFELQHDGKYGSWKKDTSFDLPCDRCGEIVPALTQRFVLDDGRGKARGPKHHGKKNSYLCEPCANSEGYHLSKWAYR